MRRSGSFLVIGALVAMLLGMAGCGGGKQGQTTAKPRLASKKLTYRAGLRKDAVTVTSGGRVGAVRLEHITYPSVDGQEVPALLSIPADRKPQGCIVYQPGFAQSKEQNPGLFQGAAALGLAAFTIDARNVGARGSVAQALAAVRRPETLAEMVADTAVDVRVGIDYLERRPECHHKIAYMGTSFGAVVGAIVAGQDPRIKATVLTSIGPSFERGMLMSARQAKLDPSFRIVMVPGAATDPKVLAHAVGVLGPYDPARWVGRIAPRPVMLVNGRDDPLVSHADARDVAAAARDPKKVLNVAAAHDPFAPGPGQREATVQVAEFLVHKLGLKIA
jgi:fermentation-respiration switch protein FrsA (DUF1100 family)